MDGMQRHHLMQLSFRRSQFCSSKCSWFSLFLTLLSQLCCFAVALNFQSLGFPMDLNGGRFQDNGGCGYVLKPAVLMSGQSSFDPGCGQHRFSPTHLLLKVQIRSTGRWIIHSGWIYGFTVGVMLEHSVWVCAFCVHVCMCLCFTI